MFKPDVLLVYTGLLVCVVGLASVVRPLSFLAIRTRRRGLVVLGFGLLWVAVAARFLTPYFLNLVVEVQGVAHMSPSFNRRLSSG